MRALFDGRGCCRDGAGQGMPAAALASTEIRG
jgi:hypothetical protein